MNQKIGSYITQKVARISYKAYIYIPTSLPPEPPMDLVGYILFCKKATQVRAELNSIHKSTPIG